MDLRPFVEKLRSELADAAETGGAEARALAERLFMPLESATRLTLLDALSAAADEITRDLAPGSVHVRLRGRDPDFVVTPAEPRFEQPAAGPSRPESPGPPALPASMVASDSDDGGTSRINLRLPDHLKSRVEEAAGLAGLSVNSWLVRAVGATLEPADPRSAHRTEPQRGQRFTGWVR